MGFRNRVQNTDDAGRREVMAACLSLRARQGRAREAALIARQLGPLATAAQVLAVAAANPSDFTVAGNTVTLSTNAYTEAKHHPQPSQLAPH